MTLRNRKPAAIKETSRRKTPPFPFILEELESLRPTVKHMFGFTYVYLGEKLLFMLSDRKTQPSTNGMWLFTTADDIDSLGKEFPGLSKRQLWRSGDKAWIVLASRLGEFEEFAFKACQLILDGDRRVGRVTRGGFEQEVTQHDFAPTLRNPKEDWP